MVYVEKARGTSTRLDARVLSALEKGYIELLPSAPATAEKERTEAGGEKGLGLDVPGSGEDPFGGVWGLKGSRLAVWAGGVRNESVLGVTGGDCWVVVGLGGSESPVTPPMWSGRPVKERGAGRAAMGCSDG
jgi:hypothetical protein